MSRLGSHTDPHVRGAGGEQAGLAVRRLGSHTDPHVTPGRCCLDWAPSRVGIDCVLTSYRMHSPYLKLHGHYLSLPLASL